MTGEALDDKAAFWRSLLDRMRQVPGVETASLARVPPGGWEGIGLGGVVPGDREGAEAFSPAWNIVESGYFATLRIPLLEGRDFASNDTVGAAPVAIIGRSVARRLWPGQSAIGRSLRLPPVNASRGRNEQRLATVIGVVADIKSSSLIDGLAEPYVYLPVGQSDGMDLTGQMSIVARGRGGVSLAPLMATLVQTIDPRLVLARTESLADAIALGLTPQRVVATVSGVMGLVALLLTSMGIYGVTAYAVTLRRGSSPFVSRSARRGHVSCGWRAGRARCRGCRLVHRSGDRTWRGARHRRVLLRVARGSRANPDRHGDAVWRHRRGRVRCAREPGGSRQLASRASGRLTSPGLTLLTCDICRM